MDTPKRSISSPDEIKEGMIVKRPHDLPDVVIVMLKGRSVYYRFEGMPEDLEALFMTSKSFFNNFRTGSILCYR